jgi:hypothetical protein
VALVKRRAMPTGPQPPERLERFVPDEWSLPPQPLDEHVTEWEFEHWRKSEPSMPGARPVAFGQQHTATGTVTSSIACTPSAAFGVLSSMN